MEELPCCLSVANLLIQQAGFWCVQLGCTVASDALVNSRELNSNAVVIYLGEPALL